MTYPLAVEWAEAARVSAVGFLGVFSVLALLTVATLAYGAVARKILAASGDDKNKK